MQPYPDLIIMHGTTLQALQYEKSLEDCYSKQGETKPMDWIPSGNLNYNIHNTWSEMSHN